MPCPHTNSQTERTENHSSQTAAPSCNETSLAPQGASASFPAPEEAIDADAEATTHDRQRTAAVADGGRQDDLQQGEAEIDGNEFAEDGIQQQLDDANNAAEELLRVCEYFLFCTTTLPVQQVSCSAARGSRLSLVLG